MPGSSQGSPDGPGRLASAANDAPRLAHGPVDRAFERLARFVVRFRVLVVAFWLAVVVVTSAALPSLGSEVNNENSAFLPSSAASSKATELGAPLLGGNHGSTIVIVATRTGGLTAADQAVIAREIEAAARVGHVSAVQNVGISADGEAAQIRVRLNVSRSDIVEQTAIVEALERTFARLHAPAGLELRLAGQVATQVANQKSSNRAGGQVQGYSILFIIVLLGIVFRSPLAAIVTLLPSALALAVSTRLIGELGAHGLNISSVTQVLLIVLLLGAGTDYGLFLVFRMREEVRDGHAPREAVVRSLVRVGESITASAGTVMLALLTLVLASFGLYHDLGVPLALGVAVMLALGITLLPALLAIFGMASFWPARVRAGQQHGGAWAKVAGRLVRTPGRTL
ncbi:MAG: MMPL family transporter, partial [Acidobacteriota bacterium]|nr:MMPL family transporter [Acidobacteriota bacterium]